MLMVIFGAGASYDSFAGALPPAYPLVRPPLANQLFDQRFGDDYSGFPQCHPVIPFLQQPGANVESVLEGLQQEAQQYSPGLTQLAAIRYYLQRMLWRCQTDWTQQVTKGVTNYKTLLDQIARRPIGKGKVCLVTFNYDTLLDEALTSRGIQLQSIPDYVRSDFNLIKLHGSINWAHEVRNFEASDWNQMNMIPEIINKTPTLDINGNTFEIVHPDPFSRPFHKPLFPALSIPVEIKSGYECPQEHQKALKDCLPQVTRVLIIGWRASENQFLKTLADGLPKNASIMVVSRDEGSASLIVSRIMSAIRGTRGIIGDVFAARNSFSNFISSSEANEFLR